MVDFVVVAPGIRIETRTSHLQGKHLITKLQSQSIILLPIVSELLGRVKVAVGSPGLGPFSGLVCLATVYSGSMGISSCNFLS